MARPLSALLLLALVVLPALPPIAQAADATVAPEWMEAEVVVDLREMPTIAIGATFAIHEFGIEGTALSAAQLRSVDASTNGTVVAVLTAVVEDRFDDIVAGALGPPVLLSPIDGPTSRLLDYGNDTADPYEQPLRLGVRARYRVEASSYGLAPTADVGASLRGALTLGATPSSTLQVEVPAGDRLQLQLLAMAGSGLSGGGPLQGDPHWVFDNLLGSEVLQQRIELTLAALSPAPVAQTNISLAAHVDVLDFDAITLNATVSIGALASSGDAPLLPAELGGIDIVTADGVRMAVAAGVTSWERIDLVYVQPRLRTAEAQLAPLVGPVRLGLVWRPQTQVGFAPATMDGPPLVGDLQVELLSPGLGDQGRALAWALLNSSGAVLLRMPAAADLTTGTIDLLLPIGVRVADSGGAPVTLQGARTMVQLALGRATELRLIGEGERYDRNRTQAQITLSIGDTQTDPAQILTRWQAVVPTAVRVEVEIDHVATTDLLNGTSLGAVEIPFADANLLRALLAEGYVHHSDLDNLTTQATIRLAAALSAALGQQVDLRMTLVDETLSPTARGPLRIVGLAQVLRTKDLGSTERTEVPPTASGSVSGALAVVEIGQRFALRGQEGWVLTYVLRFPSSVEVTRIEAQHPAQVDAVGRTVRVRFPDAPGVAGHNNVTVFVSPTIAATAAVVVASPACLLLLAVTIIVALLTVRQWRVRRSRDPIERRLRRANRKRLRPPRSARAPVARRLRRGERDR